MVLMTIFLSFSRATKAGGCQAAESADSSVLSCWHLDGVPGLSDIDPGQGRPVRRAPSRAHRIDAVGCASSTSEFRCLRSTPPRSSHTLPAVRRRPPHASTSLLIRTVARRRGRSPARCTVQNLPRGVCCAPAPTSSHVPCPAGGTALRCQAASEGLRARTKARLRLLACLHGDLQSVRLLARWATSWRKWGEEGATASSRNRPACTRRASGTTKLSRNSFKRRRWRRATLGGRTLARILTSALYASCGIRED